MEKLIFTTENGEEAELVVLGQVRMSGFDYILVSEDDDEDAEVWIMKDVSGAEEDDAAYVPVEDEDEISAILPLFEEMFDEEDTEEE